MAQKGETSTIRIPMSPVAKLCIIGIAGMVIVSLALIVFFVVSRQQAKAAALTGEGQPQKQQTAAPKPAGAKPEAAPAEKTVDPLTVLLQDGNKALGENKGAQAVQLFQKACARKSDSIDAWLGLIAAYRKLGEMKQAWQSCERALASTRGRRTELRRSYAHLAMDCARPTEALAQITELLHYLPDDVDGHTVAAEALLDLGRSGTALEHARQAVTVEPGNREARLALGRALVKEEQPEEAVQILSKVLAEAPGSPRASLALATAQRQAGDKAGAQETLTKVDQQLANDKTELVEVRLDEKGELPPGAVGSDQALAAMAAAEKAELLLREGKGEAGIAEYEKLAEKYPGLASIQYRLAELNMLAGRAEVARQQAEAQLRRDPGDARGHTLLARLYLRKRLFGLAEQECNRALTSPPGTPARTTALKVLAIARNRAGDHEAATTRMQEYLQERPKDMDAIVRLSAFQAASNAQEAALATIGKAEQEFPQAAQLPVQKALLLHQAGDVPGAIAALRRAVELRQDSVRLRLMLVSLLLEDKQPQEALSIARKAREMAPQQHLPADTLGWCLVQNDKLAEALPHLQFAIAAAPSAPRYRYHYAVLLNREKKTKEAARELQAALASPRRFPEREEAGTLLATLTGKE
jgi:tetratricopeptide (TPR) repeat protein